MNSRQRLRETFRYGRPDRVPYFEEPIRKEVIRSWRTQGMPRDADLSRMFPSDRFEEIELNLEPRPGPAAWPSSDAGLDQLRRSLDPEMPGRFPKDWSRRVRLGARVITCCCRRCIAVFSSRWVWMAGTGFPKWPACFSEEPRVVRECMAIQGDLAARMARKMLEKVEVDAAVFSEPIGGNTGPLISPRMYEEFVLKSYEPLLEVLSRHNVEIVIFRTYANARLLLPSILKWGFNCLWACEVDAAAMDYRDIRREFGRDLRLIGGIDLDALRRGREAIRREIMEKVPPLLDSGGYIPLADGRVREDVLYENYLYYRELLADATRGR